MLKNSQNCGESAKTTLFLRRFRFSSSFLFLVRAMNFESFLFRRRRSSCCTIPFPLKKKAPSLLSFSCCSCVAFSACSKVQCSHFLSQNHAHSSFASYSFIFAMCTPKKCRKWQKIIEKALKTGQFSSKIHNILTFFAIFQHFFNDLSTISLYIIRIFAIFRPFLAIFQH